MSRIKTPITGITTTSSYEEGSCYSLVNLRPKNGALYPVAPRKVMQELSQKYDIVFVHQNKGEYENWIGIINDKNYPRIYWKILSDSPKIIEDYSEIREKINSIEQIGNTLSLITDSNIYYLLFQNGNYTFLGELPQLPVIDFKTSDQMSHAKHYFSDEYGKNTIKPENFLDATKGLVNKAIDILVNGRADKDGKVIGGFGLHLFDAHFVRYAFRLYDGSLTKHSPPILIMPIRPIVGKEAEGNSDSIKTISYDFDSTLRTESYVEVFGYRIAMMYDFIQDETFARWKDIIKSIDIFLSQPLGLSSIENIREDMPTTDTPRSLVYNLIKGMPPEALKNVENTSTFYLVRSIELGVKIDPFGDYDFLPSSESDISKMENLIFQEVMSDDQFSHHKIGAEVSYAYNNRLHLANIKTTFFRGFNPKYFFWHNSHTRFPIKNEAGETIGWEDNTQGNYNGYLYKDAPGTIYQTLMFELDIAVGSTLEKVYSGYSGIYNGNIYEVFLSAFLSYPDPRAQRITLYGIDYRNNWFKLFTAPMQKHNLLNLSFYINEGLKPIVSEYEPKLAESKTEIYNPISLIENKIKVSQLNNPIVFPVANTYLAGNGTVLALATNAIRISEGQFGQYPLYVFTTQGIYSLNVGSGEVVYSNISAPTSYEIPTTKIVASTPFGVVFTSARGICIIQGQEVQLLTLRLQEAPRDLKIEFMGPMEDTIHKFDSKTFADYLRQLDNLVYDPYENELIICDKESKFNYVLNLYSQSFYQSTEKMDLVVDNTYPQLYVIGDDVLKNFEFPDTDNTGNPRKIDVSFILRPLQYGMPYIKWLEKIQLFCTLYDVNPLVYISHSSMDGINFKAMSGMAPKQRANNSTLETMRIAGNKYREFLFCFGATLDPKSVIDYMYSWIGAEYKDNLMR